MTEIFAYGNGMLAGEIVVSEEYDKRIQSGEILSLSCDFLRLKPEQHTERQPDIVFHGLSLLTRERPPRDKQALIISSSRRELTVMENITPITSSREVKTTTEGEDMERAKALMYAAKQRFNLSDQDCYDMGGEAIAHLGHAAIHATNADRTTDPIQQAYHQWKASQHVTLAAAQSMSKLEEKMQESCDDPNCICNLVEDGAE